MTRTDVIVPWDTWAVREFLPTLPLGVCPRYGGMPICREFRFFVVDGETRCRHPYWPRHALDDGGVAADLDYDALCRLDGGTKRQLTDLANAAGRAVGGAWSVDILETRRGWLSPTWLKPRSRGPTARTLSRRVLTIGRSP